MIALNARCWDRIELLSTEISHQPEEIADLPWARERIAQVRRTRVGVELQLGPYIGQIALPGDVVITIEELVPGTVDACLPLALPNIRLAEESGPRSSRRSAPLTRVALAFTRALAAYTEGGIEREYRTEKRALVRPRGKLVLMDTLRHERARGRRNTLVCQNRLLTDDTPANRVLLAAANRAEPLASDYPDERALLASATVALTGARIEALPEFALARYEARVGSRVPVPLLDLAEMIILGVPLPPAEEPESGAPINAWLNLERLFEAAVRSAAALAFPTATVQRGAECDVALLRAIEPQRDVVMKRADPDVVVTLHDKVVILDAKYRRHGERVDESELYQLMAHASAFGASAAAIVAPALHEQPRTNDLGRDRNETTYHVIAVDAASAASISEGVRAWIAEALAAPSTS